MTKYGSTIFLLGISFFPFFHQCFQHVHSEQRRLFTITDLIPIFKKMIFRHHQLESGNLTKTYSDPFVYLLKSLRIIPKKNQNWFNLFWKKISSNKNSALWELAHRYTSALFRIIISNNWMLLITAIYFYFNLHKQWKFYSNCIIISNNSVCPVWCACGNCFEI